MPSGITATVGTTTATIGEYADYANFSSLALATALDPAVENVGRELSYRLGQSLSAIVRAVADGANSIDSSVRFGNAASTTLALSGIRSQVQSMAGRAILPFNEAEALFAGVIHPFAVGDLLNDTTNNGPIDVLKHWYNGAYKTYLYRGTSLPRQSRGNLYGAVTTEMIGALAMIQSELAGDREHGMKETSMPTNTLDRPWVIYVAHSNYIGETLDKS